MPLHPIQVEQPFSNWILKLIGPINPPSSMDHKCILTKIEYFTKWVKFVALKEENETFFLNFY
jgi:hypothetical protein